MKLPRPLSHSSITLYNECPQKYKFKYIDGVPERPRHFFSFGHSVHSALEYFYGVKIPTAPTLEELLRSYAETWVSAGYRDRGQEDEYREEGRRILTAFHEKHSRDFKLPYFVEYAFTFEVDGVPVTGRIDRVDKLPDGRLGVIDYKTGKKLASGRLETDAQLTMYQLACERLLGAEVSELTFYHLPSLTEHRAARRPGGLIDELQARIVSTAQAITTEKFEPRPEEMKCRWCDFKPLCPIFKSPTATTPPLIADAELAALVDAYGTARDAVEKARAEADAAGTKLAGALRKRGYTRAFGAAYEASVTTAAKWEFEDKKAVLEALRSAGVYEKILAPSAPLVNKLLDDPATDRDLRARVAELGERVEFPEVKVKAL